MNMSLTKKNILEFIKRMDLKITMEPYVHQPDRISVALRVTKDGHLEYFCRDYFELNDVRELVWEDSDCGVRVDEGILAYLGDNNAVDNFFMDLSLDFAQKIMDDEIKNRITTQFSKKERFS